MDMNVQETVAALEATKADLMEHGWNQGDYFANGHGSAYFYTGVIPEDGPACLMGACVRVRRGEIRIDDPMVGALKQRIGGGYIGIWNDEPGRTFNEVVELIDDTILDVKRQAADGESS